METGDHSLRFLISILLVCDHSFCVSVILSIFYRTKTDKLLLLTYLHSDLFGINIVLNLLLMRKQMEVTVDSI